MPRTADINSCRTCRTRRIKCDGHLPICHRCSKRGIYCDRSQKFNLKHYDPTKTKAAEVEGPPRELLQQTEIARLFQVYIQELAPWYDLNDEARAFERQGAEMALDSPLLFSAAIAFAGIYMHRTSAFPKSYADSFHGRCLNLLIALSGEDEAIRDGTALASTCLLRSYEILMYEDEDPNRHLFGASTLVPHMPQLDDHSLLASGFWNYLREDITYSLIHQCPLKIQIEPVVVQAAADDEFANSITLLLGRTVNSFFGQEQVDLLAEILEWRLKFGREPFSRIEDGVFPAPKCLKDCQVAALHYYHVALCMLEPENRPFHAAEIVGLALSAESPTVWINAYGPICFTGQFLVSGEQRQNVVTFLRSTEKRTGWNLGFIISKLRRNWEESDLQLASP
jgi:Fungal Zn(2)-Cys(6) binuclear cluster domain